MGHSARRIRTPEMVLVTILAGFGAIATAAQGSRGPHDTGCRTGSPALTTDIDARFLGQYFQGGRWQTTIVLEPGGTGYYSSRMRKQIRNITRGWIYRYNQRRIPLTWAVRSGNGSPCISRATIRKPGSDMVVDAMTIDLRYGRVAEQKPLFVDNGTPRLGRATQIDPRHGGPSR